MSDAKSFGLALDAFGKLTVEQHKQICQKVALDVLNGVVERSPVDTGRFRGAWLVTNETPTVFAPEGARGQAETLSEGASEVERAKDFPVIYVQNNVEYAEAIENGHSQHAPTGVVAVTMANIESGLS